MTSPLHRNEATTSRGPMPSARPRAARWHLWQSDADAIWENNPNLSRHSVARLVKRRLQLSEQADSIARRIRRNCCSKR